MLRAPGDHKKGYVVIFISIGIRQGEKKAARVMMIRDRVPNTNDANTRYQTSNKMVGREREKTNYTNVARLALGSVAVAARSVPSAGEITNELKSKRRCTRRAYKEEKKKTKSSAALSKFNSSRHSFHAHEFESSCRDSIGRSLTDETR